jgi:AcrR family transcriptional regulator
MWLIVSRLALLRHTGEGRVGEKGKRDLAEAGKTKRPREAPEPRIRRAYLPAAERKRLIIEAAQQVFARSNLQGARTRDIAKAADVNQATLFEHFGSKEVLFHEAVVEPLIAAMQGMRERAKAYAEASTTEEMMALARTSSQRQVETMTAIFPLMTAALFSDPELGRKLYVEQIAPLLAERGAAIRGLTRDDLDIEVVELAHFGAFFALAMDQHFRGETRDPAMLAEQITRIASLGFAKDRDVH